MIDFWIGLGIWFVVLLLDGLLAASRSALVNSPSNKLRNLIEEGDTGAILASEVISEATRFLLSLRLGLSLLRLLGLGLGLGLFLPLLVNGRIDWLLFAVLLAGLGIVLGGIEFLAENLALRDPAAWAIRLARFVTVLVKLLSPVGNSMLLVAGWIAGSRDGRRHALVTEEEIMTLVDAGQEGGAIEQDEKAMIYSIFQLDDTLAREVMIPRIDMLAFEETTSLEDAADQLLETGYSRAPVYRENVDNVLGLIYVKDLLNAWRQGKVEGVVRDLMREAYFVPEAKKVDDLLEELQANRIHMAVVVDEYGGTAGLVTIEDIVEEIFGEIRDEYDLAEEARYQHVGEGEFIFTGGIDLDDVNQITGADLPKDTSETLGGFIYGKLGRVPASGDSVEAGGLHLEVEQVVRRRIRRVRAKLLFGPALRVEEQPDPEEEVELEGKPQEQLE